VAEYANRGRPNFLEVLLLENGSTPVVF